MNIPENIIQQVADEAFLSSNGGMMGLLTCNKEKNHVFWHEERCERRAVIQHALDNPALAPFLAEPAAQVPLGPEDVPPGSVFRNAEVCWYNVKYVLDNCVCIDISGGNTLYYEELKTERWQINSSIPDTGRWDATAWRPCSKPGKEVPSENTTH